MNKGNDESTSSSDSESDQDYVPSAKELRDGDDECPSEQNSDDSDADDENGAKRRKKSDRCRTGDKRRKIVVEAAEETRSTSPQPQPPSPSFVHDLWNDFKKDCEQASKATARSTSAVPKENGEKKSSSSSASASSSSPPPPLETTTTTTTKKADVEKEATVVVDSELAGDTVEKEERTSSIHEPSRRESCLSSTVGTSQNAAGAGASASTSLSSDSGSGSGDVEPTAAQPAPAFRPARGNLNSALGLLNKKNKLSILEQSKMDWDTFKTKEGIVEELRSHNKGKAGYLEKQDFLQRTDLRQFEIEKAMRSSRRTK